MTPPTAPPLDSKPLLDYAPVAPWHRRRGRRVFVLLLIVGAVVIAWRPAVGVHGEFLRGGRVASLFYSGRGDAPAAGTVAFEQDPVLAAPLYGGWRFDYGRFDLPYSPMASGAVRIPEAVRRLFPDRDNAVLFLHERATPGGVRRLVLVEARVVWYRHFNNYGAFAVYHFCRLTLRTTTYSFDGPWGTPPRVRVTTASDPDVFVAYDNTGKPPDLRVFAGQ